jgi:hypothetical protein
MKKILFALTLVSLSAFAANTETTQVCQGNAEGCKKYCEETLDGVYTPSQSNSGSCTWTGTATWNFNGGASKVPAKK